MSVTADARAVADFLRGEVEAGDTDLRDIAAQAARVARVLESLSEDDK